MDSTVNAQVAADAELLLNYLGAKGLDQAVQVNPGHAHMGGLIVDSALQRRQRYASMVAPRVAQLITVKDDEHLQQVMAHAASLRDWRVGDLNAVLWASHAS